MKEITNHKSLSKWLWTGVIAAANVVLWAVPSNLAYNVAQQREILLGRYTLDYTVAIIVVGIISVLIVKDLWSKQKPKAARGKEQTFKIVALSTSIVLSLAAVDIILRIVEKNQYVKYKSFYSRVPNTIQKGVNKDVPPTAFSYPRNSQGYPDLDYTLSTDKWGFRNSTNYESYDMVTLGDSFTEGSHVSDNQSWPVLLAQKSNSKIYNLGMSGGDPATYMETLEKFGLKLSPKTVICTFYEGNDFRSSNFTENENRGLPSLSDIFKTSPIRNSMKRALIRSLSPVNKNRFKTPDGKKATYNQPSHPLYAVSWLPVKIPEGPDAKFYTFKIKRLTTHFITEEALLKSAGLQKSLSYLGDINDLCAKHKIRFVVVYIPDKPHLVMPLLKNKLPPEHLHAFMALREEDLPTPEKLLDVLLERIEIHEASVEKFCHDKGIEFVSLTKPMRDAISNGQQAYYTYDQHWTPVGHEIAAEILYKYLSNSREVNLQ